MSSDTVGLRISERAKSQERRAEMQLPALGSLLQALFCALKAPYGFAGAAGAGFCVAGGGVAAGGVAAGGTAGGIAGLAVDGAGAAGFAPAGAAGFGAAAYLPESNRLITSPVMSSEGST